MTKRVIFKHCWKTHKPQSTNNSSKDLQALVIDIYKILDGYAPPIMENLFVFRENVHNIRNF